MSLQVSLSNDHNEWAKLVKKIRLIIDVLRYSKYHFKGSLFTNFLNLYILSSGEVSPDKAPLLYQDTQDIPVFQLDDVYLGFLIQAFKLTLHNDFYIWGLDLDPRCPGGSLG